MLSKFKINDPGDTDLLPGGHYSKFEIEEANQKAAEEGGDLQRLTDSAGYHQGFSCNKLLPVGRHPSRRLRDF